jgi:VWFA-related protein
MNFQLRILLPLLLPLPLLAQQSSPVPSAPPTVQLDVTVSGHSGKPVPGLTQSNFTVTDNGTPQQILSFRAVQAPSSDPPVQVIVLIDTVNTTFLKVTYERDQISQFLRKSGPTLPYPLSFVFFANTDTQMQRVPSQNTAALLAEFDKQVTGLRTIGRSAGFEGASERLQLSLKVLSQVAALEQGIPGRKLLIWISPGWPYLSGPQIRLSEGNRRGIFSSVVDLSTMLQSARITLYSVDPVGVASTGLSFSNYYAAFLNNVTSL